VRRRAGHPGGGRPVRGQRVLGAAADADRIRQAFADTPDATLGEVKARLGLAIGLTTLWRAVTALGLTVKKKSSGRPSRTART
jgi:hypothetical protein